MHPNVTRDPLCFDAFAVQALAMGIEEVCITDHMPLSVSSARDRIPKGHVEEYCQIVRNIAKQYKGQLSVRLGIEIDYHPDFTDEIEAVLDAGAFDYVIGASHLHIMRQDIFSTIKTHNEFARATLENTILAANSGYFDTIAHLDMYRWVFTLPKRFPLKDDGYTFKDNIPLIENTLDAIVKNGLRLELNPHLAVQAQNISLMYPETPVVKMALEKGVQFTYGSDAHTPEQVGALLDELRLHLVYGQALHNWEADE